MIARHWPLTSQAPKHATGELPRGQQGDMETRHRLVHACFASEDSVRKAARLHGEAAAGVPRCLSEFPGDSSRMTAMRPP
jgi:hypothetical protein